MKLILKNIEYNKRAIFMSLLGCPTLIDNEVDAIMFTIVVPEYIDHNFENNSKFNISA